MSPMLLHLAATLLQAFFPALQEAGFLNVQYVTFHGNWCAQMAPIFLDFKNS